MWPIVNSGSILNWWIGSIFIRAALVHRPAAGNRISNVVTSRQRSASARGYAGRSHHVDHAGDKAEQQKHDETERRCRQQTVETPANHSPDDNARDQLRGKAETKRHGRGPGSPVAAFSSGLVSPDFAAVTNFGQPVI